MNKKLQIGIYFLIAFVFLGWNKKIIPYRYEINKIDITKVIGLDRNEEDPNKVDFSIVKKSTKGNSGENKEKSNDSSKEKIISVSTDSFVKALKLTQNYSDKQIPREYVKYIVIGENLARNNFREALDFLAHDSEIRLNSRVYLTKGASAFKVLSDGTSEEYELDDKISNIGNNIDSLGISGEVKLVELFNTTISENTAGVIPVLEQIKQQKTDNPNWVTRVADSSGAKDTDEKLTIGGYAVIKDAKLVDFLEFDESRAYNAIRNKLNSTAFELVKDGKKITLSLTRQHTDTDFLFEEDKLLKIQINTQFVTDLTEGNTDDNLFKNEISWIQEEQSNLAKKEIEKVARKSQELNADFLKFGESLNLKYPYKWANVKENWEEIFKSVPIEVNISSEVRRTYDLFSLGKEGIQ